VLTSHDLLGNTGKKTGFWLEEFAAPYFVFRDAEVQWRRDRARLAELNME
jgi:putative intracellular protease/amidase